MESNIPTNDVVAISDALAKNGIGLVLLAVFIVLFLALFGFVMYSNKKNFDSMKDENGKQLQTSIKQSEQMFSNMMQQYNEVFSALIAQLNGPKEDEKPPAKNLVDIFIKINDALKVECKSAQNEINADRLAVYVFHNGSHSSHGFPFIKTSCVSEFIQRASGLVCQIQEQSGLPLNMFENMIQTLYDNSEFIIPDTNSLKDDDPMTYGFVSGQKIKSVLLVGVYDDAGALMGFISAAFKNQLEIEDINLKKRILIELGIKIKPVLQFSDFQKYTSSM